MDHRVLRLWLDQNQNNCLSVTFKLQPSYDFLLAELVKTINVAFGRTF